MHAGSYYVTQAGRGEPSWHERYGDAVAEFKELVKRFPLRQACVFLFGSDSSIWYHAGDIWWKEKEAAKKREEEATKP